MADIDEARVGPYLFAFDGRILEVFGYIQAVGGTRFHVGLMKLTIEPMRKNRTSVIIDQGGQGAISQSFLFEEADMVILAPFLDRVRAALG